MDLGLIIITQSPSNKLIYNDESNDDNNDDDGQDSVRDREEEED